MFLWKKEIVIDFVKALEHKRAIETSHARVMFFEGFSRKPQKDCKKIEIRHSFTYLRDTMILFEIVMFSKLEVPCFGSTVSLSLLFAKHTEGRFLSEFPGILVILRRPGAGGRPLYKRQGDVSQTIWIN